MKQHRPRTLMLYLVCLLAAGAVAWWVISALLSILFKLVLGAVVVAGAIYLVGRATRGLDDDGRPRLDRNRGSR
jgi:hypothetical protein